MKFLNSLLVFTFAISSVATVATAANKSGIEKPGSKSVETFASALKSIGLGAKVEGLKRLAEVNPGIEKVLEKVSREIGKAKAKKNIEANKAQFDKLVDNIDGAAYQAAEMRATGKTFSGSSEKILSAIDALPGMMLEIANNGPKADVQKALDVSEILAKVTEKDLSNEADASAKVQQIEARMGNDAKGNPIKLEDFIRDCFGA